MAKRSIAVMVLLETDDPRLFVENLDHAAPAATATLRKAVIDNLPNLTRLVLVTSEENARIMTQAHTAVMQELGFGDSVIRPPAGYVPPTRE